MWSYLHCQIGRTTSAIHLRLCDEDFLFRSSIFRNPKRYKGAFVNDNFFQSFNSFIQWSFQHRNFHLFFSTAPKSFFSSPYCATRRCKQSRSKRILIDRSFCWSVCVKLSALWDRESYNCDPFAIVSWRFFVPIEYISHFKEVGAFTIAKWKQRIISNEKMNLILNFLVRFPPKCWMLKPLIITADCHSIATLSHFLPCSFFQLRDSH